MKNIAYALTIVAGLALSATAFAPPPPKVAVCHFSEEEGTWLLKQLPEPAAQAHLRNHDDASPGGVTAITGTQLDANCQPAAPGGTTGGGTGDGGTGGFSL